ncbi:conserved Plasmodium protein, unknown function [Plasmodium vinckei lentum]|uniref:Uncharacterized protein n=1 Tax=Plasmodium vinckei lentum TaxID=138297 RepID=A0A6V7RVJ4_PLAVN|nr:conserved Plasmodium protein, unknown function [Plasmodium vinckei lentum]
MDERFSNGFIPDVENITKIKEYLNQGDIGFENEDLKKEREKIRSNDVFIECVKNIWTNILNKKLNDKFSKIEYFKIMLRICKVLIPQFEIKQVIKIINDEWNNDSKGKKYLNFDSFFNTFFELADIWTPTINAHDYALFLKSLFYRITFIQIKNKNGEITKKKPIIIINFKRNIGVGDNKKLSIFDNEESITASSSDPIQTESKDSTSKSDNKNINNESEQIKKGIAQNNNTHESFENYDQDENEESAKKLFEILLNNKEKDPKIQRSILLLDVNEISPLEPLADNINENNNTYIQGISKMDELFSKMSITRKIYHDFEKNNQSRESISKDNRGIKKFNEFQIKLNELDSSNTKEEYKRNVLSSSTIENNKLDSKKEVDKNRRKTDGSIISMLSKLKFIGGKNKTQSKTDQISEEEKPKEEHKDDRKDQHTDEHKGEQFYGSNMVTTEEMGKLSNESSLLIDGINLEEFTKECKIEGSNDSDTEELDEDTSGKILNESDKIMSESGKTEDVTDKIMNESNKIMSESGKTEDVTDKIMNESGKIMNKSGKIMNESAQALSKTSKDISTDLVDDLGRDTNISNDKNEDAASKNKDKKNETCNYRKGDSKMTEEEKAMENKAILSGIDTMKTINGDGSLGTKGEIKESDKNEFEINNRNKEINEFNQEYKNSKINQNNEESGEMHYLDEEYINVLKENLKEKDCIEIKNDNINDSNDVENIKLDDKKLNQISNENISNERDDMLKTKNYLENEKRTLEELENKEKLKKIASSKSNYNSLDGLINDSKINLEGNYSTNDDSLNFMNNKTNIDNKQNDNSFEIKNIHLDGELKKSPKSGMNEILKKSASGSIINPDLEQSKDVIDSSEIDGGDSKERSKYEKEVLKCEKEETKENEIEKENEEMKRSKIEKENEEMKQNEIEKEKEEMKQNEIKKQKELLLETVRKSISSNCESYKEDFNMFLNKIEKNELMKNAEENGEGKGRENEEEEGEENEEKKWGDEEDNEWEDNKEDYDNIIRKCVTTKIQNEKNEYETKNLENKKNDLIQNLGIKSVCGKEEENNNNINHEFIKINKILNDVIIKSEIGLIEKENENLLSAQVDQKKVKEFQIEQLNKIPNELNEEFQDLLKNEKEVKNIIFQDYQTDDILFNHEEGLIASSGEVCKKEEQLEKQASGDPLFQHKEDNIINDAENENNINNDVENENNITNDMESKNDMTNDVENEKNIYPLKHVQSKSIHEEAQNISNFYDEITKKSLSVEKYGNDISSNDDSDKLKSDLENRTHYDSFDPNSETEKGEKLNEASKSFERVKDEGKTNEKTDEEVKFEEKVYKPSEINEESNDNTISEIKKIEESVSIYEQMATTENLVDDTEFTEDKLEYIKLYHKNNDERNKLKYLFVDDINKMRNFIKINKKTKKENFIIISNSCPNIYNLIKKLKVEFIEPSIILNKNFKIDKELLSPLGKLINLNLENGKSIDLKIMMDLTLEYMNTMISKNNGYVLYLNKNFIQYTEYFLLKLRKLSNLNYINYINFLNMNFLKNVSNTTEINVSDFLLEDHNLIFPNPFKDSFPVFCIFLNIHKLSICSNIEPEPVDEAFQRLLIAFKNKNVNPQNAASNDAKEKELNVISKEGEDKDSSDEIKTESIKDESSNDESEDVSESREENDETSEKEEDNKSDEGNELEQEKKEISDDTQDKEQNKTAIILSENLEHIKSDGYSDVEYLSIDSIEKNYLETEPVNEANEVKEEEEESTTDTETDAETDSEYEESSEEETESEESSEEETESEENDETKKNKDKENRWEKKYGKTSEYINMINANDISDKYFNLANKRINYIYKCNDPIKYYINYYKDLKTYSESIKYEKDISTIVSHNSVELQCDDFQVKETDEMCEENKNELENKLKKIFETLKIIHIDIIKNRSINKLFYINMIKNNYSYFFKNNFFPYKYQKKREMLGGDIEKEETEKNSNTYVEDTEINYKNDILVIKLKRKTNLTDLESENIITSCVEVNKTDVDKAENVEKNKKKNNKEEYEYYYRNWNEFYKFCPVSYIDEKKFTKGKKGFKIIYKNKVYILENYEKMIEFLKFPQFYSSKKIKESINFNIIIYFPNIWIKNKILNFLNSYEKIIHIDVEEYFKNIFKSKDEMSKDNLDIYMFEFNNLVKGKQISDILIVRYICIQMKKTNNFNMYIIKKIIGNLNFLKNEIIELLETKNDLPFSEEDNILNESSGDQQNSASTLRTNFNESNKLKEISTIAIKIRYLYNLLVIKKNEKMNLHLNNLLDPIFSSQNLECINEGIDKFSLHLIKTFEKEKNTQMCNSNRLDISIESISNIVDVEGSDSSLYKEHSQRNECSPNLSKEIVSNNSFIISGLPLNMNIYKYFKKIEINIDNIIGFNIKRKKKQTFKCEFEKQVAKQKIKKDSSINNGNNYDNMYLYNKDYIKMLNELEKENYNLNILNLDEEYNSVYENNKYEYLDQIQKLINPYIHNYLSYNSVLENDKLIDKINNCYINMYCPYILKKYNWLYKSRNNIKLIYNKKIHFLSNPYHSLLFMKNINFYSNNFNVVPPLRILFLSDYESIFEKEVNYISHIFSLNIVNIEKEFLMNLTYICIYILKYIYLFKLSKFNNKKKLDFNILPIHIIPFEKFEEDIYLGDEDIQFLENNISYFDKEIYEIQLVDPKCDEYIYDILFDQIKPSNVILNILKILTTRLILHEQLGNCLITYLYDRKSVFSITSGEQMKNLLKSILMDIRTDSCPSKLDVKNGTTDMENAHTPLNIASNKVNDKMGEEIDNTKLDKIDTDRINKEKNNLNKDCESVNNQQVETKFFKERFYTNINDSNEFFSSDTNSSDSEDDDSTYDSDDPFPYKKDVISIEQTEEIFSKKNENKILRSKYKFLENSILNNFEKVLKYSYRVPEYVIYLACDEGKNYKKLKAKIKQYDKFYQTIEEKFKEEKYGKQIINEKLNVKKDNKINLDKIKKICKKNKKIVKYLERNTNIWKIDIGKVHIKNVRTFIENRLKDMLQYRNNLFHQLNIKRVDKTWANFLKNNNYIKLSSFYFYSPVNIDSIVNIDTNYLLIYDSFLFYFRTENELNTFSKNPIHYLNQIKPSPKFILPFIFLYTNIHIDSIYEYLKKSNLKYKIINLQNLLSFGYGIEKYKKQIDQNKINDELIIELIKLRRNQYDILSHGCILYNIPFNDNQLASFFMGKEIPHLVFLIRDKNVWKNKPNICICNGNYNELNSICPNMPNCLNIDNTNFYEFINNIEERIPKQYNNVIYIEYNNMWKMKYEIENAIEEKIKSYQRYNRYKYNNKVAYFKGFNIYEKENYEQEIKFNKYCIVTYKKKNILEKCNIYDNYTVYYDGNYYLVNTYEDVLDFETNPEIYVNVEEPSKKFEKIINLEEDIKIENEGFCLVSLKNENNFVKGNKNYCIKYENAYYLFENEDKMETFVNNSKDYLYNQNMFDIIIEKIKSTNDITTLVYLKTYLYDIICQGLYELGKHRPLYPGLTVKLSAIHFLAFFFYKENKQFSTSLRRKYEQRFKSFLMECEIPINIQKLKKKFENKSTLKNQSIKKATKDWTKRDIEKYKNYINLYDKILFSQKNKINN